MSDLLEMAVLMQKQLVAREQAKLQGLKAESKGNSIQKEILKKAIDLRTNEAVQGQAMIGNQPIPVEAGAEALPFLDEATVRR
tara:strand:- start:10281 stop:10529 length:249 start_codon:yes stop_codon:yes gene_type:complete